MTRLPVLALLIVAGCDTLGFGSGNDGLVCTLEFRSIGVEVVDGDGAPVAGLDAETVIVETGERLDRSASVDGGQGGVYVVASDAHVERLDEDGTALRFTASGDTLTASAEFVIAGGPCHVSKLSGPDQIVARPR